MRQENSGLRNEENLRGKFMRSLNFIRLRDNDAIILEIRALNACRDCIDTP